MGALTDLISKVQDTELRDKLLDEAKRLSKQKKFGLVYEDHIPECTPLWDIPVKRGSLVARKSGNIQESFIVRAINGANARCYSESTKMPTDIPLAELVTVAKFGQPIYPCLKMMDSICNAPDSDLWHTLIEADNYHALQLLEYLYAGKVDCIYIDPPYNTGAKDWKYNNNYVDAADAYRHSKWLSFMEKRLKLAKKLLNPNDSVLIVTIDEKEYLHLGCLLEELFPEANIQMISSVINHAGNGRLGDFGRINEYIFYVRIGACVIIPHDNKVAETNEVVWDTLRRHNPASTRPNRPRQFYPIYIRINDRKIVEIGDPITPDVDRFSVPSIPGCETVFPVKDDGTEMMWGVIPEECRRRYEGGFIRVGKHCPQKPQQFSLQMLSAGTIADIEAGKVLVVGHRDDGSVIAIHPDGKKVLPKNQWDKDTHDARYFGTELLRQIIGDRFSYPKSLYAVKDTLKYVVSNNKNAIIVDFFAGSGTTLHAVNLLNAEDGGHRRCIMVTNNEVSEDEAKRLSEQGYHPGDSEWEQYGIARYVNWPRTKCSILGKDVNDNPLTDEYLTTKKKTVGVDRKIVQVSMNGDELTNDAKKSLISLLNGAIPQNALSNNNHYILSEDYTVSVLFDSSSVDEWLEQLPDYPQIDTIYVVTRSKQTFKKARDGILESMPPMTKEEPVKIPMAEGFKANAVFFKLGFLDKNAVALGRQFREMLPTLWMKAGAFGQCPTLPEGQEIPALLALPENRFAVLTEETAFAELERVTAEHPEIETVFIITDHEAGFRMMAERLQVKNAYQLYRDYLDNFRINVVRS